MIAPFGYVICLPCTCTFYLEFQILFTDNFMESKPFSFDPRKYWNNWSEISSSYTLSKGFNKIWNCGKVGKLYRPLEFTKRISITPSWLFLVCIWITKESEVNGWLFKGSIWNSLQRDIWEMQGMKNIQ